MEILTHEELIEHVNILIDFLSENEDSFCIPLEIAHQLRDEIVQIISEEQSEDE